MEELDNNKLDQSWILDDSLSAAEKITEPASEMIPATQPESVPSSEPIKSHHLIREIFKAIGIFVGCFIFIYLFLTFPSYWTKANYYWNKSFHKTSNTLELPVNLDQTQGDIFLATLMDALEKSPDKTITKKYTIDISDLEDNYLIIPKISVKVPIIWNVAPEESLMLKNLQNGVVHYNGTAIPEEEKGNVFIAGHSSYYWWDKGDYKTIFANLDKLESGDELALAYDSKVYIYKVFDKVVVRPEQTEVLEAIDKPILSLMTCVPVGTNLKRLVIKAERLQITSPKQEQEQSELQKLQEIQKKTQESTSPSSTTGNKVIPQIEKNPLELLPWVN